MARHSREIADTAEEKRKTTEDSRGLSNAAVAPNWSENRASIRKGSEASERFATEEAALEALADTLLQAYLPKHNHVQERKPT